MPISDTSKRHEVLSNQLRQLRDQGLMDLKLRSIQDYPEHLLLAESPDTQAAAFEDSEDVAALVDSEDEDYVPIDTPEDLLTRAFADPPPPPVEGDPWIFLAKGIVRGPSRVALYRFGDQPGAYHVTDITPTNHQTSVLGRFGVLNLVVDSLSTLLGSMRTNPVTIADLARLTNDMDALNAEDLARSVAKHFGRLNAGEFVDEDEVSNLAATLGIPPDDLCFDNPSVYDEDTWARREKLLNERRADAKESLIDVLRNVPVRFELLRALRPGQLRNLAAERGNIDYEPLFEPTTDPAASASRDKALIHFINTLEKARKKKNPYHILAHAIVELETLGVCTWVGQYIDRLLISPNEQTEMESSFDVRARRVQRVIVAFREREAGPPSYSVDLSHTADLGRTIEEIEF